MTIFKNIGRSTVRHAIKRYIVDTAIVKVEAFCGKVLEAPWVDDNSRHPICTGCDSKYKELLDSIKEFKCNLCDFTTPHQDRRDGHYEKAHPINIKKDEDKEESKKWFTIIFKKKFKGHELKIEYMPDQGYVGSCTCGRGKFYGVVDEILCHKQFTEHMRESEVLPIGF